MDLQSNLHNSQNQITKTSQISNLPMDLQVQKNRGDLTLGQPGISTGVNQIDDYLFWQGIPQGELSLLHGLPGTGATSLWIRMLQKVSGSGRMAAWINSESQLMPAYLQQVNVKLDKVLVVREPKNHSQTFAILQELITSSLFETVGCHLKEFFFKNHQLERLKQLARQYQVALVFIAQKPLDLINPLLSLIIEFKKEFITIKRALHRHAPYSFGRENEGVLLWNNL